MSNTTLKHFRDCYPTMTNAQHLTGYHLWLTSGAQIESDDTGAWFATMRNGDILEIRKNGNAFPVKDEVEA